MGIIRDPISALNENYRQSGFAQLFGNDSTPGAGADNYSVYMFVAHKLDSVTVFADDLGLIKANHLVAYVVFISPMPRTSVITL